MTAFANALASALRTLKVHAGVTIRYTQDGGSATLTAVPANTPVELLEAEDAVSQQLRYTDWLIDPTELVLGGSRVEPRRNATVEVTDESHALYGATFVVTPPPADRQVWRYSDEHARAWLRVHTLMTGDGATV